jgi:hypothetical protein
MFPVAEVPAPHMAPVDFINRATWVGVLRYCVQRSGMDDYEIADKLDISHGYMAKVLRGTANLSGARLTRFMAITQCIAPAQWHAWHVGADLVMRDPAAARIAELERELQALKRVA